MAFQHIPFDLNFLRGILLSMNRIRGASAHCELLPWSPVLAPPPPRDTSSPCSRDTDTRGRLPRGAVPNNGSTAEAPGVTCGAVWCRPPTVAQGLPGAAPNSCVQRGTGDVGLGSSARPGFRVHRDVPRSQKCVIFIRGGGQRHQNVRGRDGESGGGDGTGGPCADGGPSVTRPLGGPC